MEQVFHIHLEFTSLEKDVLQFNLACSAGQRNLECTVRPRRNHGGTDTTTNCLIIMCTLHYSDHWYHHQVVQNVLMGRTILVASHVGGRGTRAPRPRENGGPMGLRNHVLMWRRPGQQQLGCFELAPGLAWESNVPVSHGHGRGDGRTIEKKNRARREVDERSMEHFLPHFFLFFVG
jgi:hypothetical protein